MPSTLVRRVDVIWTGIAGAPYYTGMYFGHETGQANATVTALSAFFNGIRGFWITGLTATLDAAQTIIDSATGLPTSTEVSSTAPAFNGGGSGPMHPPATQGLIRMKTNLYLGGRRVQGRMYIPGMITLSGSNVPSSSFKTGVDNFANGLITATATSGAWAVYSRKKLSWASVAQASTWDQWAVQRSRRD